MTYHSRLDRTGTSAARARVRSDLRHGRARSRARGVRQNPLARPVPRAPRPRARAARPPGGIRFRVDLAAAAALAPYKSLPTTINITTPLKSAPPAGKTIVMLGTNNPRT